MASSFVAGRNVSYNKKKRGALIGSQQKNESYELYRVRQGFAVMQKHRKPH